MNGKYLMVGVLMLWLYFNKSFLDRGIRNNNPMNVKSSNIDWDGAAGIQTDETFVQFESPVFGLRAGAKILLNYERLHFLNTIRSIINRWAPPSDDNPTSDYVDFVAKQIGLDADMFLSVEDNLVYLLPAIVQFENGENPYRPEIYKEAIKNALTS